MIDLLCGAKITSKDPLKRASIHRIYKAILGGSESLSRTVQQLRFIKTLNEKQYTIMKRELPFITTSWFNPRVRKQDHFAYSECLVLDVDHIAQKQHSIDILKEQLKQDSRIMLMFTSPSNDGLKLFFRLNEKIYDPVKYSLFYRQFGTDFSMQYGLEQIIDLSTCDVSRACFMSYDTGAYLNTEAETLDTYSWIPKTDYELTELCDKNPALKQHIKPQQTKSHLSTPIDPDEEILRDIKEWVGVRVKKIQQEKEKDIYVPDKLVDLQALIIEFLASKQLEVYESRNINYGIKLKIKLGDKDAEINIFLGKRGFSVVESPKQGTSSELNRVAKELLLVFLNDIDI